MEPKQARLEALREFLTQAGKRLSGATIDAIKAVIDTLGTLIGETEPDEAAVEQAFAKSQAILCQAMVTGISTADTYEELIWRLSRAVRGDKTLPGDFRYTIFTHQEWVAFEAYSRETYDSVGIYIADYADSGAAITFSNVRDASIETIIRTIEESLAGSTAQKLEALRDTSEVAGCSILSDKTGSVLLQSIRNGVICQKRDDGRYVIQGVATHGDVVNKCNPPIVFPTTLWASELASIQKSVSDGKAIGCLGHPTTDDGDYRDPTESENAMRFTKISFCSRR
jgi:hypothetical protein